MCGSLCVHERPCVPLYDVGAVVLPPNQTLANVTPLPRGVNIPGNQAPDEKTAAPTLTYIYICTHTLIQRQKHSDVCAEAWVTQHVLVS